VTRIHLVRHAPHAHQRSRIVGRADGMHLPEASRRIAERLAERLAGEGIAAVYCSPLERARETAAPLAARLGVEVEICPEANEVDYGEWTNCAVEELRAHALWERYNRCRSLTRIPGGETMVEVQARMVGLLERLRGRHPDQAVALVGHGDPIRSAICFYLGIPLDLMQRIETAPASISVLDLSDWGARLVRLNEVVG
jgi:probable phosphoglycerate mutase